MRGSWQGWPRGGRGEERLQGGVTGEGRGVGGRNGDRLEVRKGKGKGRGRV